MTHQCREEAHKCMASPASRHAGEAMIHLMTTRHCMLRDRAPPKKLLCPMVTSSMPMVIIDSGAAEVSVVRSNVLMCNICFRAKMHKISL